MFLFHCLDSGDIGYPKMNFDSMRKPQTSQVKPLGSLVYTVNENTGREVKCLKVENQKGNDEMSPVNSQTDLSIDHGMVPGTESEVPAATTSKRKNILIKLILFA